MDDVRNIDMVHRSSLRNQDLGFLRENAEEFLGEYGWYLLFMTVCVIVLIDYLSKKRASWVSMRSSNETPQDPALIMRTQEALEASRRRLQEDVDVKAA
ncbi:selenoprotein S-like [Gadus macrocephalus]|uniref:selenoprotein S-like n=1 Tax=Gadus macrocephalus TaxID=80720 RepID=UPI0028CB9EB5|nr:selenoprotein S-like [Gadus macrocephalus]